MLSVSLRCGDTKNRSAKDGDLIGERRVVSINAEELVVVFNEIEIVVVRLFFDDDDDIFEQRGKTFGQLIECLLDELPEFKRSVLDCRKGRLHNKVGGATGWSFHVTSGGNGSLDQIPFAMCAYVI